MGFYYLIARVADIYCLLIIIRAVLSWTPVSGRNPAVDFLDKITEPVLAPFRRLVPPSSLGGLDISPILAIVVIRLLVRLLLF